MDNPNSNAEQARMCQLSLGEVWDAEAHTAEERREIRREIDALRELPEFKEFRPLLGIDGNAVDKPMRTLNQEYKPKNSEVKPDGRED